MGQILHCLSEQDRGGSGSLGFRFLDRDLLGGFIDTAVVTGVPTIPAVVVAVLTQPNTVVALAKGTVSVA